MKQGTFFIRKLMYRKSASMGLPADLVTVGFNKATAWSAFKGERTMAHHPELPPLVEALGLAGQNIKMYPLIDGINREDATDNAEKLWVWAKEHGECAWAVATGPNFNVIALEVIEARGIQMIRNMIKMGEIEETDDGYNTLNIDARGRNRPIFFWIYPEGAQAETKVKVEFPGQGVRLHVEEGSVTLPKNCEAGSADYIAKCPNILKDSAFIPGLKKVVMAVRNDPEKSGSENQRIA
jgi:hypothetical protein